MGQNLDSFSTYRGKPLVKKDNVICCGDPKDSAILILTVLTYKTVNGEEVPDDIIIQVQSTDPSIPLASRTIKQGMKKGLYQALDFGCSWLDNTLNKNA